MKKQNTYKYRKRKETNGFNWVYVIGTVVVIGGVMAFGLVSTLQFHVQREQAIGMLGMVFPMAFFYYVAIGPVVRNLQKKIARLTEAMDEVAEGNLECQIDTNHAGEYEDVYKKFNAMTLELKKTKEEMESFTNEFAHEFKTPITAISGFADYLLETGKEIETEERLQQLEMISQESKRLLNLSMNTLLLSKVEAMQVVSDKEEYDLAEQLRRCVILLSKPMDKKSIDVDMDEDLTLMIYANQELLQHVWNNLLSNAVKFTKKGGVITISGEQKKDEITVRIRDDGIGMDEETVKHIFEKYYQNDKTGNLTKGSGIGLSIVKRIVVICGGSISVSSYPGSGTTFSVTLPVR